MKPLCIPFHHSRMLGDESPFLICLLVDVWLLGSLVAVLADLAVVAGAVQIELRVLVAMGIKEVQVVPPVVKISFVLGMLIFGT